ncbi:YwmB family TATA-box binding protein [Tepidibacillus sp. LV47]|uniref:YwmB family TATA-box binding protein n=1 Tax=Tepidibacillus sp. LV47 TaxID=3398228 RepID=UPI003AAAC494
MINKKYLGLFLLVSILFIFGMTIPNNHTNDLQLLIKGFQEAQAELSAYYLHVGIPYQQIKEEQLLAKGNELSEIFHIPFGRIERVNKEPFYISKGKWRNNTEVELQLKKINENTGTYLVIKVTGNHSLKNLEADYQTFYKKLQKAHINSKINTCIQGKINDKLDNVGQYRLIQNLLNKFDAKMIEELKTDLVTSVSAYSLRFGQVIQTRGGQMNIQVATHYDSLHNQTILTIGTPIITIEY